MKFPLGVTRDARVASKLGLVYWDTDQWKEKVELDEMTLAENRRLLGDEHPETLWSMVNITLTYRSQGRMKEAEELQVATMEGRKQVLGEDHLSMLWSMANLTGTYA